jgi:hypothetical protein
MKQGEFEPAKWLTSGLWSLTKTIEQGARYGELRLPVAAWAIALGFLWGIHALWALLQISGCFEALFIPPCHVAEIFGAAWLGHIVNRARIGGEIDPEVQQWIRQVAARGTLQVIHDFEALNVPRKFAVQFVFRIAGESADHLQMLKVRLEAKKTPEEEMKCVQDRLVQLLQPLVSDLPPEILIMNDRRFWLEVENRINLYASPILAEEFGYRITISNLFRGKNTLERSLDGFEDAPIVKRLDDLSTLLEQSFTHWATEVRSKGFNLNDPDAAKVHQTVEKLDETVRNLKKDINERQHVEVRQSPNIDPVALNRLASESLDRMQHSIDARKRLLLPNPPRNST